MIVTMSKTTMSKTTPNNPAPKTKVSCQITGIAHDLRGVARVQSNVWFVDGALPGEQVQASPVGAVRSKSVVDATVLRVEENTSPLRCEPACEHYAVCGGCSVQHIAYDGQVTLKQQALLQQLQRLGNVVPQQVLPPVLSPAWEYRRRARLSIRRDGANRIVLGFRQRQSHAVVPVPACRVLRPALRALLEPLHICLSQWSNTRQLGHVDLLEDDGLVQISVRVVGAAQDSDLALLRTFASEQQITVWLEAGEADEADSSHSVLVAGQSHVDGVLPTDFLQGNAAANEAMITAAQAALALQATDRVLDAFCGVGNFTLPIATQAAAVTACDVVPGMVQRTVERVRQAGFGNVSCRAVNLETADAAASLSGVDKILLDPPRTGAKQFCTDVPLSGVTRLVYVSCNPATLARDAAILVQRGWTLMSVQLVDMFPQTAHIECVAVFLPMPAKQRQTLKTGAKTRNRSPWK